VHDAGGVPLVEISADLFERLSSRRKSGVDTALPAAESWFQ
jgi:hypothetical protein